MAVSETKINQADLKPGAAVFTVDGLRLGRLKDLSASGSFFKVDVRLQRDYWLSRDDILETGHERVTLSFSKAELESRKLEHSLRLSRASFDTAAAVRPQEVEHALRTIVFTDVEEHTAMMQRLGDEKGRQLLRDHESITREALAEHGGAEVKTMGDGFMASFPSAQRALNCSISLQRSFAVRNELASEAIRVRIGINAGEPISENGDLFGASVIAAARIAAKANGGEILAANVVRELVAGKGFLFADRGDVVLRGLEDPIRLYEVNWLEEL
jgi:class 3 adenylate cyclase